jgi:glucosamine-6-phosphate deaminase
MTRSNSPEVRLLADPRAATHFAADWLVDELTSPNIRNIMLAGGNTPLGLYAAVAERKASLRHLKAFILDEYVGVPLEEPRNCANLIYDRAIKPWGIPRKSYHSVSSLEAEASSSISDHERKISDAGGLDLVILGLGKNGHVGFNEPGSEINSPGRLVQLSETSINSNREWFQGDYAPCLGVTTGMKTILAAKKILLLAFGVAKAPAVFAMLKSPPSSSCPASFLQSHPNTLIVLDEQAAADLRSVGKKP